jgi:hypothetical protein
VFAHGLRAEQMSGNQYVVTTPNGFKLLGNITASGGDFLVGAVIESQMEYLGNHLSLTDALGAPADANAH